MKEIFIFDIDGCILPQIFPSIYENNGTSEKLIREAAKKSKAISIYSDFIKFYEKYCKNAYYVVFITGRQKSYFNEITDKQLSPLKIIKLFDVFYYPEDRAHTTEQYFNWKVEKIKECFNGNIKIIIDNKISKSEFYFKIFDDMDGYFTRIKEIAEERELNYILKSISSPEMWKNLLI